MGQGTESFDPCGAASKTSSQLSIIRLRRIARWKGARGNKHLSRPCTQVTGAGAWTPARKAKSNQSQIFSLASLSYTQALSPLISRHAALCKT